jgi:hypothetical protein
MHTGPKAPKSLVLRQCDVFEKEIVAQEILEVRPCNYTGCEKNIFRSCKGRGGNAAAKVSAVGLDQSCVRRGLISKLCIC